MNWLPSCGLRLLGSLLSAFIILSPGLAAPSNLSEKEQRDVFKEEVRKLALAGAFDRLETAAEDIRTKQSRFAGGQLHLHSFYTAFYELSAMAPDAEWEKLIQALRSWCDAKKDSPTPRIALAQAYAGYAWKSRTTQAASQVTEEGFAGMQQRLSKASEVLAEAKTLPKQCPGYYAVMQRVALGTGMPRPEYDALVEDAIKNAGFYDMTHGYRAYFLLPRWYGGPGEWERVTIETMGRPDVPDAPEVFAKAAMYLNSLGYLTQEFSRSPESWDALKRSFAALQKHYPGSLETASVFCRVAATIPDLETVREQWRVIGGRFDPSCWTAEEFGAIAKTLGAGSPVAPTRPGGLSAPQRFNPVPHLQKDAEGNVWIHDVPAAARRATPYSVITSTERVLRYFMGMQVNEAELAQFTDTFAASNGRMAVWFDFLKSMEGRWKLRVREPLKTDSKALQELVRDYNRAAKRMKSREISDRATTPSDIYGLMDPQVIKEARTKNVVEMNRFFRDVQGSINAGIPVIWAVQLGLVDEENKPMLSGLHTRLIVGYNARTQEVIYSFSDRPQRLKLEDAWTMTYGTTTLEPIN